MKRKLFAAFFLLAALLQLAGCGQNAAPKTAGSAAPQNGDKSENFTKNSSSVYPAPSSAAGPSLSGATSAASSSSPFAPYRQPVLPPEPLEKIQGEKLLWGDWHYYANPEEHSVINPTYQIRLGKGQLLLSFGTLDSDSAVHYQGTYTFSGGTLTGQLSRKDEDAAPEAIHLTAEILHSPQAPNTMVFHLSAQDQTPAFAEYFGPILEKDLPFVRYG